MNRKTINFTSNTKDCRNIAANVLNVVSQRLANELQNNITEMNSSLISGNKIEILSKIEKIVEDLKEICEDLENTSELVSLIEDEPAEEPQED